MPHRKSIANRPAGRQLSASSLRSEVERRYTVGLAQSLASEVERYSRAVDTSMSKAIAALVRQGLESQENRKREFFRKLRANLETHDPDQQDRLVDEFRALILGR